MENVKSNASTITVDCRGGNVISVSTGVNEARESSNNFCQARVIVSTANKELVFVAKKTESLLVLPMGSQVLN